MLDIGRRTPFGNVHAFCQLPDARRVALEQVLSAGGATIVRAADSADVTHIFVAAEVVEHPYRLRAFAPAVVLLEKSPADFLTGVTDKLGGSRREA